jgi:hypothetical protein
MIRRYLAHWRTENDAARSWKGGYSRYDIVKEITIAIGVVLAMVVVLTVLFSSPDERPSTIAQWSTQMPVDFVTTATSELDGTSGTATYGPPYNNNSDGQHAWFIHLQKWFGVSYPIDTAKDFVIDPLKSIPGQPGLTNAIDTYEAASATQQNAWTTAYSNALASTAHPPTVTAENSVSVPPGDYGPVPLMMSSLLSLAQSGGVDGALLTSDQFYQTDYTKPLLFLADGSELSNRAQAEHLLGEQWGMMNETGSYPGQVWLWLYTFWYQIAPFNTSANADILVMLVMGVLSLAFILIPFLPIVRDIPRWIPLHRVIWREHYRSLRDTEAT